MLNNADTLEAWEKFIANETPAPEGIPGYVVNSWKECKRKGINPHSVPLPEVLSPKKMRALEKKYAELIRAAQPIMRMIAISTRSTNSITLLATPDGTLLAVDGDETVLTPRERKLNKPGCVCSPDEMGGRAITLCIKEKRPLSLCGAEHYCSDFHSSSCYAAPIYDNDGNAVGSIGVSGWTSHWHPHTLALVTAAAETISTRLREAVLARNQLRLNSMILSVYNSLPEAILSIDSDGNITHANRKASALLMMEPDELQGIHLGTLLHADHKEEVLNLIGKGEVSSCDIRFMDSEESELHHCRFQPAFLEPQQPAGMTLVITSQQQLLEMAKSMEGNYAHYDFHHIKGQSPNLRECLTLARKVANSNSRVLITGESGTGKELFAQAIHNNSPCRKGPFVAISCAAIPRELVEAEFFGYVGGAFTGARKKGAPGKFELATGGTLFLDEINSLPLDMQAKLLRAIQQGQIMRIGADKPTPVQVRIIAATNTDLLQEVEKRNFREDLYYRLNVVGLSIPPLRDRTTDIPTLARHIVGKVCKDMDIPQPIVTKDFLNLLLSYDWPGNVRELYNVCERAIVIADGQELDARHASDIVHKGEHMPYVSTVATLKESTRALLEQAISLHGGNVTRAAKSLGISRSTLYRKLEQSKKK
jgi:transcriptional regulator with PAS, ATPase and Fis domain